MPCLFENPKRVFLTHSKNTDAEGNNLAVRVGVRVSFAPLAPLALDGSMDFGVFALEAPGLREKSGKRVYMEGGRN